MDDASYTRHRATLDRDAGARDGGRCGYSAKEREHDVANTLRDQFLIDAQPLNKTSGQPFTIAEIEAAIEAALA